MITLKRHWVLFIVQLILYAGLLCLDLYLVDWYDSFYSAIQEKSTSRFIKELLIFIFLVIGQALVLGLVSFNSEVYEAELKKFFVTHWISFNAHDVTSLEQIKGDQKIIDDASLSAEKVAVILPAIIFNSAKALIFLLLLTQYPTSLLSDLTGLEVFKELGLSILGVTYLIIQFFIIKKANVWVLKSENIKRAIEAKTRYKLLSGSIENRDQLEQVAQSYVRAIVKIRILVAKAHGLNVVSINGISSLSFVIPFIAIFTTYSSGLITFGELMKISAIYAGFQASSLYVFNTYKEALKGIAALKRLNFKF